MDNKAQSSMKRRDGISPDREVKRLRPTEVDNPPTLSPDLFAKILEFVPFDTVLACGATCRSMLHETMPLIKTIHIDKPQQMNMTVASRFRDIKTMHINSLLSTSIGNEGGDDEYTHVNINLVTKIRVVPFISQFALLELVHFGGRDEDGNIIEGFSPTSGGFGEVDEPYPNESSQEAMLAFIDMLSGGYSCGVLKQHLTISGICCPAATDNRDRTNTCKTCIRACKSFPLQSVVEFESCGSSSNNARSGRLFCLDVCLDRVHIESIVESRPGGNKLLHSHKRLLQLLGSGRRHEITANDEPTLYIVKYKEDDLDEMKRVIKYAGLNANHLSMQMVSSAVMKSFTKVNSPIPPRNQRYLSEESLDYLVNEIGLPIDREDFELSSADLIEHTQQIVSALQLRADLLDSDEEEDPESLDIDLDCLRLIYRLLMVESIPPISSIKHMADSGILVPLLLMYLQPDTFDDSFMLEASKCLKCIITRGTDEHRKMILGADGIHDFSQLLASSDKINKVVVSSLVELVLPPKGSDENIKTLFEAGAIPCLIDLLDSRHDDCVEGALRLLVAAKVRIKRTTYKTLLPQVIKLIRSYKFYYWNYQANQSNDKIEYLTNCSVLLRKIFTTSIHVPPLIQIVIDSMAIPTLLDVLQLANDDAVKVDLEHVILNMLTNGTKEQVGGLLKEAGVLDLLVSLINSAHDDIAKRAISVVGKIAGNSDEHRDRLYQARLVTSLLRVLGNTGLDISIVQAAAGTFSKCCRDNPMDTATTKASLCVLNKALVHENEFIVANSCEAVFHILSGLSGEELKMATNRFASEAKSSELNKEINEIVEQLLKLVSHDVGQISKTSAIKTIHLISTVGDIKAITLNRGMLCLSQALSSHLEDTNQELVCGTISNIITNDTDQIQTIIDVGVVPCLIKMLEGDTAPNEEHALQVIHQMTKAGSDTQIKYLVSQNCIHYLCDLLTTSDCDVASTALSAIHDIFKVGRDEQNKLMDEESNNIQQVERKLDELTDEIRQVKLETERVTKYKQRQAWLEYHKQKEKRKSLIDAIELMTNQHQLSQSRSESYGDKVAEVGEDTSLGKTYHRLHLAEIGLKEGIEKEISDTGRELSLAQTKLEQLLSDTNESTSEEKQNEQIANLSEEIVSNTNALETAKSNLESMNDARISPDKKTNLAPLEGGIRQLFKGVSIRRLMKMVFVPLRKSEVVNHARDVEFTFKICKDSKLKALRAYIVEMARKHYGYDENELKEEDVQLADIWAKKVWAFLNDMESSINLIKDKDVTYAYQMYPLDKVQKESIVHKAKKEKAEQEKQTASPSEDGNSSDNDLSSRLLSPSGELDPLTKADLNIGDRWTVALEKYLGQPMTLSRLTATARATDQERSQFYLQLLRFISKCKDCSDAKPPEEGKKSNEEDGKVTLDEVSHMSQQFKNVNTPKDLAIFEYCMGKFREMMSKRKKKEKEEKNEEEKTKNEDGVVVQIQIRKSDTSTSHYGHNPYSSSSERSKTSWKLVGEAPIVARISPTLSVSGIREMLGRRLACGPLKLNSDENHSNGDDSLPSQVLSIMNQVALSWEEKANSRFGLAALGTVTLDQLAENPPNPVFANPSDKEEKELVTEIVDDGCIIVVDWPMQLNGNLDGDALSAAKDRVVADDCHIVEVSSGIV